MIRLMIDWQPDDLMPGEPLLPPPQAEGLCQVLQQAADGVFGALQLAGQAVVYLRICSRTAIHEINLQTRGVDRPTDVLSFPNIAWKAPVPAGYDLSRHRSAVDPEVHAVFLGDVLLCHSQAVQQAEEYGHSLQREYAFLLTHALLHLLGNDHITPQQEADMRARQRLALQAAGYSRQS